MFSRLFGITATYASVECIYSHTVQEFEMTYRNRMLVHAHYVGSIKFYKLAMFVFLFPH